MILIDINCFWMKKMNLLKAVVCAALVLLTHSFSAVAQISALDNASFELTEIQVDGLQRVTLGAALLNLALREGDTLDPQGIAQATKNLYRSGHFDDVKVYRDGGLLRFVVSERPTISNIEFTGNEDIKTEQLEESLETSGIRVGDPLDRTQLRVISKGLEDFYFAVGKYSAGVEAIVTPLPRNRVDLKFNFIEGPSAAIEQINLLGNDAFSRGRLMQQLQLTDHLPWWNVMGDAQYQKQALAGDLERLNSFYFDRGYIRFKVENTLVSMTPDRKGIYITLKLDEGEIYTVSEIAVIGNLIDKEDEIKALLKVVPGATYNGSDVTASEKAIGQLLGRFGYAYPKVTTFPEIDDENNSVKITLNLEPGKRVYVRRINFSGNVITKDEVLRREMRQMEGTWLSSVLVERSKARLNRTGFFETTDIETIRVPGHDDLVDLIVNVKEQSAGSFNAGVGYGTESGLSFQLGVTQDNFLGSGNKAGINLNTNKYSKNASLEYTDRYFTKHAVSFGGRLFYSAFEAGQANIVDYNNETIGVRGTLGFPADELNRFSFGAGAEMNKISQLKAYAQVQRFWDIYSEQTNDDASATFNTLDFTLGWSRNALNHGTTPTAGSTQKFSSKITVPGSDLQYFKLRYEGKQYWPVTDSHNWVFAVRGKLGYGNGYGQTSDGNDHILPFFEHLYAGGYSTVRGFRSNTVGPKAIYLVNNNGSDLMAATNQAVGGNTYAVAGLEFIVPTPFLDEAYQRQVRTTLFVDAGTVWDTEFDYERFSQMECASNCEYLSDYSQPDQIRVSAGVALQWISPMGPLIFSLAKPLKQYEGDRDEVFNFTIGQTF